MGTHMDVHVKSIYKHAYQEAWLGVTKDNLLLKIVAHAAKLLQYKDFLVSFNNPAIYCSAM